MTDDAGQKVDLRAVAGAWHLPDLPRVDRHDVENAVADQADLAAVDLHDDDDVQRGRLGQPLPEATPQIDDRHDRTAQIEHAAHIFRLLRQMSDVRPTLDLAHGHDVDAVLIVADREADELDLRRGACGVGLGLKGAGGTAGFRHRGVRRGYLHHGHCSYKLDGVEVSKMSADQLAEIRNLKIGFVFQGFNLLARTTALENVELPLLYREQEIPAKERKERCEACLTAVGLGHRFDHVPTQLSGGEQQRVAIARALVTQPSLVLADEPTGNLDSRTSVEVMRIFQELNEQKNITILLVTHEPDIAQYAKRVITFKDGKIKSDLPQKNRLIATQVLKTMEDEEE